MTEDKPKGVPVQAGEKYIVRFPEGMRERIAEAAKASNRSMNSEIVERLERSFAPEEAHVTRSQLERVLKAITAQQETIKMLGGALEAVSDAHVPRQTSFGKTVAQRFAAIGSHYKEGRIKEGATAMSDIVRMLNEWSNSDASKEVLENDKKLFPDKHQP